MHMYSMRIVGVSTGEVAATIAEVSSPASALAQQLFLFNVALLRERRVLNERMWPQGHYGPLVRRLHYYPNAAALFLLDLINTRVLKRSLEVSLLPPSCYHFDSKQE